MATLIEAFSIHFATSTVTQYLNRFGSDMRDLPGSKRMQIYLKMGLVVAGLMVASGLVIGRYAPFLILLTTLILAFGFTSILIGEQEKIDMIQRERDSLRQKAKTVDEFMASLAHDMRTPLTTVEMYSRILSDSESLTNQQRKHMANMLLSSNQALLDLVERIPEKKYTFIEERFDVGISTRDAVALVTVQAEKKNIQVHAEKIDNIAVDGSPTLVKRALLNLLANAIKYTPEGGDVYVSVVEENGQAAIGIQDTGIGIAEEELPFIFQPFRRGIREDSTISGKGLGLAVVQQVVDAHSGNINVQSQEGIGSSFTLYLPLAEQIALQPVDHRISA